jgi:hypothetical protein
MVRNPRLGRSQIAIIHKLRRAARELVADVKTADLLVERTLRTALDDIDRYIPEGGSTEKCLVKLLKGLAAHKADVLH